MGRNSNATGEAYGGASPSSDANPDAYQRRVDQPLQTHSHSQVSALPSYGIRTSWKGHCEQWQSVRRGNQVSLQSSHVHIPIIHYAQHDSDYQTYCCPFALYIGRCVGDLQFLEESTDLLHNDRTRSDIFQASTRNGILGVTHLIGSVDAQFIQTENERVLEKNALLIAFRKQVSARYGTSKGTSVTTDFRHIPTELERRIIQQQKDDLNLKAIRTTSLGQRMVNSEASPPVDGGTNQPQI